MRDVRVPTHEPEQSLTTPSTSPSTSTSISPPSISPSISYSELQSAHEEAMWESVKKAQLKTGLAGAAAVKRPPNGFTIQEYAEKFGLSYTAAAHQIKKLLSAAVLVECLVMIPDRTGRKHPMRVFTPAAQLNRRPDGGEVAGKIASKRRDRHATQPRNDGRGRG